MSVAGVVFWLFLAEYVASMETFHSGSFSSCSTPVSNRSVANPFTSGNQLRSLQEVKAETDPSILITVDELWNNARSTNTTRSKQHTDINRRLAKPIKLPDDYDGCACLRDCRYKWLDLRRSSYFF